MTAPNFVNAGGVGNQNFGSTISPTLPGSRVNGNVLIAMVVEDGGGNHTFTISGTGWVGPFDHQSSGGVSSAIFYCIVNGSEAQPTITASGNFSGNAIIYQYHGVVGSFVPATFRHTVSSGTTVTETGVTTTANDSLVIVLVGGANSTTTIGAATNYTTDQAATGAGGNTTEAAFSETKATAGSASDAFSTTVGTGGGNPGWVAYSIELPSQAAGGGGAGGSTKRLFPIEDSKRLTPLKNASRLFPVT